MNPSKHSPQIPLPNPNINTLIIVCCHAIFIGPNSKSASTCLNPYDETQWLLAPFQKGETSTFISHVRTGMALLHDKPDAILCFSGGATKPAEVRITEAESYKRIAEMLLEEDVSGSELLSVEKEGLVGRMFEERWATDSFQNVLLSLVGFRLWRDQYHERYGRMSERKSSKSAEGQAFKARSAGRRVHDTDQSIGEVTAEEWLALPEKLIIVSHDFKRARFTELHLPAIGRLLPAELRQDFNMMGVKYVGVNPTFTDTELKSVEEGERRRGYEPWIKDEFGTGMFLAGKRQERGWSLENFLKDFLGRLEREGLDQETVKLAMKEIRSLFEGSNGTGQTM